MVEAEGTRTTRFFTPSCAAGTPSVLEVSAIKVYPIKLAKGELSAHYRLGWEEKRKAGGTSLVENRNLVDLPDRLPEGVKLPGHWDPGTTAPMSNTPLPTEAPR